MVVVLFLDDCVDSAIRPSPISNAKTDVEWHGLSYTVLQAC